jgi:hypothetical protein
MLQCTANLDWMLQSRKQSPRLGSHMICICDQIVWKGHNMLDAGPFPTIWVSQETVAPWLAVAIYAFIAGFSGVAGMAARRTALVIGAAQQRRGQ